MNGDATAGFDLALTRRVRGERVCTGRRCVGLRGSGGDERGELDERTVRQRERRRLVDELRQRRRNQRRSVCGRLRSDDGTYGDADDSADYGTHDDERPDEQPGKRQL